MEDIKKLFERGYDELDFKEVLKHIEKILSFRGEDRYRLAGSNWEVKTAEYIAEKLNEYGYKIELQKVPVDIWRYKGGYIEVDDGYNADIYTFAGITGGEADGELIYIGKGDWSHDLNGKIVLINLDFNIYDSHVMPALEAFKKGAKAVLFTYLEDSGLELYRDNTYYLYDGEPWLDGVIGIVRPKDAEELLKRVGHKAYVKIECESMNGYSYNVIGFLEGDKPLNYVVSAHHDGYNPGVMDNLSGLAYILEMARLLSEYKPPYNIEFISFTAEEYGYRGSSYDYLIGSEHFFSNVDPKDYIMVLNVDLIGLKALPIGVNYTYDLNLHISRIVSKLYDDISSGVQLSGMPSLWVDSWPAIHKGITGLTITHIARNYYFKRYYHTEKDDLTLMDEKVFREGFALGYTILLNNMDLYPHYTLSELLRDFRGKLKPHYLKPIGKSDLIEVVDEAIERLIDLEYRLEILGRYRRSSRIVKLLNIVRASIFKSVYRLGRDYPTEKYATYFPEYYNELIGNIETILHYISNGKMELAKELIMDLSINRWAYTLSNETVQTLLDMFRRGDKWAYNAVYPYLNTHSLITLEGERLEEELYSLLDRAFNNLKDEVERMYNTLNDTNEVIDLMSEMVEEWLNQSSGKLY